MDAGTHGLEEGSGGARAAGGEFPSKSMPGAVYVCYAGGGGTTISEN